MPARPFQLTPEAHVIPGYWQSPGAPVGVHMNSMVLTSAEPVLFDTGLACAGEAWLAAVSSVVDLDDVRWIVLTHDDPDHTGNLASALAHCPNATVVATWFLTTRIEPEVPIDPRRLRWVGPGETLDVGDRVLSFVRPPLYDSPTTRVVADPVGGVLWAADLFALPVLEPTDDAADLDPGFLHGGFMQFQRYNSPWVELVDRGRYQAAVDHLASFEPTAIASCHGPSFTTRAHVEHAFDLLARVPDEVVPPEPGQPVLDAIVASIAAGHPQG